ncbi:hypothetical protein A3F07_01815 [candidate division WWE3 bacterium RIFCSPHIGHO2_12_FULL_38_15]|uniref:NodB homology domain-containing protein n=1 Tax=candidate division WWE3 bacterium RIFCSPHIGHO2_02_FULL_38_14 TaxID=1802620 RepID=A0A1F4VAZ7_UNCKA|nr:MAG: hypothetical protein A2793_00470 [candidate division WWE3 bacterium RIFCSPHIGHO2_01_FULL_38_45]OGC48440.1 MAG: hypothetical protein A3F07_01815 [candidate division WWE3 bacterium RIFCSPHIGHO2_12_FULL_38_15]OGC52871.1 MAG: hypothetical protein A3B64_03590 [candidate division WWE3 bacterium RIFCSPLOWO2_01_FULL_37_24]OGC54375.1 MAG: hypothetical protein A3D91_00565 [candidate division WWE3 bacterium RIFCSPHIGHO2_02_FULL_38_14]HLB51618.1 polysaccharide deacetylase family protein [Patescibac
MKEQNKNSKSSFLFWLIIPLILVWLSLNYVVGLSKDKPKWVLSKTTGDDLFNVEPFNVKYEKVPPTTNGYVTIWLDDAWLSQHLVAAPLIRKYEYKAAIAVPPYAVEKQNYVNWAQLRTLQSDGWEINNHSYKHDCNMQNWSADKTSEDLEVATKYLWKNKLGADIFVSPCGVVSDTLLEEVKRKFIAFRSVEPGFNEIDNINPYDLKVQNITSSTTFDEVMGWIDQANNDNLWLILVFHKFDEDTGSMDADLYNISSDDFEAILYYLKQYEMKVVLPSQILSL